MSDKHDDDGGPLELAQQACLFASILYPKGDDLVTACLQRKRYVSCCTSPSGPSWYQVYQASEQVRQWVIEWMIDKKRSELQTCQLSLIQSET